VIVSIAILYVLLPAILAHGSPSHLDAVHVVNQPAENASVRGYREIAEQRLDAFTIIPESCSGGFLNEPLFPDSPYLLLDLRLIQWP
jgi:hypothetical protein